MIDLSSCQPRSTVLEGTANFVVNLDSLPKLSEAEAREFLDSNVLTSGMEELLMNAFARLGGEASASGTYLLSESMGGGKTQSLIVAGIIARFPRLVSQLSFAKPLPDASPDVVTSFTGREVGKKFWIEIGKDLGVEFDEDRAPSESEWVAALNGKSALILLDELAFYLVSLTSEGKTVEDGTRASTRASVALTNLCGAVRDHKECARSVIVISDLEKDWEQGAEELNRILKSNASLGSTVQSTSNEVSKGAHAIAPVDNQKDELYAILRKRIFGEIKASPAEIEALADAYVSELEKASSIIEHPIQQIREEITHCYPFHFSTKHLIGTFNDNPGFQKTRDAISLMAAITRSLWESGQSEVKKHHLLGLASADLNDSNVAGQFKKIKRTLAEALSTDIAGDGTSHAESYDSESNGLSSQCARWIFVGSLSEPNGRGLSDAEIAEYLIAPGKDIAGFQDALKHLYDNCWYIEQKKSGRYFFNKDRNLNAQLNSFAKLCGKEDRDALVEQKLIDMFTPKDKRCYQKLEVLPQLDGIKLERDRTTLIICGLNESIDAWFDGQHFKNRVAFLSAVDQAGVFNVNKKAQRLYAIQKVVADLTAEDSQYKKAKATHEECHTELFLAIKSVWTRLSYPLVDAKMDTALKSTDLLDSYTDEKTGHQVKYRPDDAAKGEFVIGATLREAAKYIAVDLSVSDPVKAFGTLKAKTEQFLFPPTGKATWDQILDAAACKGHMNWVEPAMLDRMREIMLKAGKWRELAGQIQKPPFAEETAVSIEYDRDPGTGKITTTSMTVIHADKLFAREDGAAWEEISQDEAFVSEAMILEFKAVDSTGKNKEGKPWRIENPIEIVCDFIESPEPGNQVLVLKTIPDCPVKFTTDGGDPANTGSLYAAPGITAPEGAVIRLFAEKASVNREEQITVPTPASPDDPATAPALDPAKPAYVSTKHLKHSTRAETYAFLQSLPDTAVLKQVSAKVAVAATNSTVSVNWDSSIAVSAASVLNAYGFLDGELAGGEWALRFAELHFATGQNLQQWQVDSGTKLDPKLITQPS